MEDMGWWEWEDRSVVNGVGQACLAKRSLSAPGV